MRLSDKVCIVTGGASGIGLATCDVFAREGAKVVIADRDLAAADKAVAALVQKGGKAIAVQCDVSNAESVAAMIQATVAAHGRLDVIVNNAGYGIAGSLSETSDEDWEALMGVNVRGVFLCCKHAIKQMQKNGGGTIVNVASVVAAVGIRNRAAYVASKGAVAAMTRSIALDYVASHIRCNAIAPGTIDTPEQRGSGNRQEGLMGPLGVRDLIDRAGEEEARLRRQLSLIAQNARGHADVAVDPGVERCLQDGAPTSGVAERPDMVEIDMPGEGACGCAVLGGDVVEASQEVVDRLVEAGEHLRVERCGGVGLSGAAGFGCGGRWSSGDVGGEVIEVAAGVIGRDHDHAPRGQVRRDEAAG